jgi:hypothetical protein
MSNGRRFRRQQKPPAHILAALAEQECPDCNSEITVRRQDGTWRGAIAHDDGCIQLAWRQRHGATSTAVIVADPGRTVPADLVAEVAGIVGKQPGVVGVRISDRAALSGSERQRIDEAMER